MPQQHIPVGLVVARRKAVNPWIDHFWVPLAVLPDMPDVLAWTVLAEEADGAQIYAGAATLTLYSVDTAQLRDNLLTERPQLWVSLRTTGGEPPLDIVGVTADPSEGEGFTEAGADIVQPVPMPHDIAAAVAAFVQEHHVERPFIKRQRRRADPDALGQRPGRGSDRPSEGARDDD
jgi:hypothetical protein